MNQGIKQDLAERVSAMLDGELAADEARFVQRRVESDADLRAAIGRYELIRSCLRNELPAIAPADFRANVMAKLDAELGAAATTAHRPWLRAAAGGLIAAGVAAAALIAVAPQQTAPTQAPIAASATPGPAPTLSGVTPIRTDDLRISGVEAQPASAGIPLGPTRAPVIYDPQLESYVMRHSNALSNSRGGFVPYVYVVSSPRYVNAQGQPARVTVLRPPVAAPADGTQR